MMCAALRKLWVEHHQQQRHKTCRKNQQEGLLAGIVHVKHALAKHMQPGWLL
jgi:hypothetical protein